MTKYRLSEHSLAIEKGRHRWKTWLPVEEGIKDLSDESRLPILLGEDAESCGLAAHYIAACHKMRDSV